MPGLRRNGPPKNILQRTDPLLYNREMDPPLFVYEEQKDDFDDWKMKWNVFLTDSGIDRLVADTNEKRDRLKLIKLGALYAAFDVSAKKLVYGWYLDDADSVIEALEASIKGSTNVCREDLFAYKKEEEEKTGEEFAPNVLKQLLGMCRFTEPVLEEKVAADVLIQAGKGKIQSKLLPSSATFANISKISAKTSNKQFNFSMHVPNCRPWEKLHSPSFEDRRVIGCYSLDKNRSVHDDRRELRFYNPETAERFRHNREVINLSQGFTKISESDFIPRRLLHIMDWIAMHPETELSKDPPDFTANRGCIKAILNTPYLYRKGEVCRVTAIKVGKTIYLSQSEKRQIRDDIGLSIHQGHKFEKHMVSTSPDKMPNPEGKEIFESEGFYCVYKTRFGSHSIVLSAELDGMMLTEDVKEMYDKKSSSDDLDLNSAKFVELKTTTVHSLPKLARYKMRDWWAHCSSVGVQTVVCGVKHGSEMATEVREIREYDLENLPGECATFWRKEVCLNFLDDFLTKVRQELGKCDEDEEPVVVIRCEKRGDRVFCETEASRGE